MAQDGARFDFGRELLGPLHFRSLGRPRVRVGESVAEANSTDPAVREQSIEVTDLGGGRWRSAHPLALRYAVIEGEEVEQVHCAAQFHPTRYRGAFACSDPVLTRIWMHSAYTLRLCMHDFLIDGIKRDRLPWMGDLAASLLSNAYSFGDGEIVRRTLRVLTSAGIERSDINGIADYTLWWFICEELFQRHYRGDPHLRQHWPHLRDGIHYLLERCDDEGFLQTREQPWIFIDWLDCPKATALQLLWRWALACAADLAARRGEEALAATCREREALLRGSLLQRCWDRDAGVWRGDPDPTSPPSRHATLLAAASGVIPDDGAATMRDALLGDDLPPVGTPYVKGFECLALDRLGAADQAVDSLRRYWGGMLEHGATTFWEGLDESAKGNERYAFYGRPFGKSLCHAWSASPCHLLPAMILGIRPLDDAWRSVRIAPALGDLTWACATVPTPQGDLSVTVERGQLTMTVPAGCRCHCGPRRVEGPTDFSAPVDVGGDVH